MLQERRALNAKVPNGGLPFFSPKGPGNNGADGIICHHYLLEYGAKSQLLLLSDGLEECWIFKKYSIHSDTVNIYSDEYTFDADKWYIDGIFGIGLRRDIDGIYKVIIQKISGFPHIISIDIPSGINETNKQVRVLVPEGTMIKGINPKEVKVTRLVDLPSPSVEEQSSDEDPAESGKDKNEG